MLKHYILISIRSLKRHKGSFFINLTGLSTGIACALLIYLWVNDEMHFDKFHAKDSQLYQVMELSNENNITVVHEATQGLLSDAMAKDLPEVESAVSVMNLENQGLYFNVKTPDKTLKASGIFASNGFFNMFSYKLKKGNANQVLAYKNNIVISEALAKNLFGTDDVIGKTLEWEVAGVVKMQAQIAGVFEQLPSYSSMKFDFVLTHDLLINDVWTNGQHWWNEGPQTYLVLKNGTDVNRFNAKIKDFIKKYHKETLFTLFTRQYSDAYLYGKYENGVQAGGRIAYVKLFSLVALFILLIACINFMNLSTAKASTRAKEVGIKKSVGSSRKALIFQFLSEAVFMSLISLAIAYVMVVLFLPVFNSITGKEIALVADPKLILLILGATLATGILSGSYPAFYLSGFNPVSVLKGKIKNSIGELLVRKGLVVFQFIISLVLIVAVLVIQMQMEFVQKKNLGYEKDNILQFDKEGAVAQNTTTFLEQMKKIPGVVNASAISQSAVQSNNNNSTYGIEWPGKTAKDQVNFVVRNVDYEMIETLGIKLKEGRSFSRQFGADSTKLIFNEAAIKTMGLKNPVGTKVTMWGNEMEIVGIVKDFHIASMYEPIAPMVLRYDPSRTTLILAKIQARKEKETIARLAEFYKTYNPGYTFDYKFLDNAYQAQYISEQRVSALSKYFAGLAILISCLGLFGLATFNAEARTKEIGIRKVLGASVSNVMFMLSKDFFKLLVISVVIAFPLAWWAMSSWLNGFAYKINIGVAVFIVAFVAILLITLITVGYQAIKAALANPVSSLRTE
jgi:ABC-type antimicrobial peptide transport system permease subunit